MRQSHCSRSQLARDTGVDRSTIGQLLVEGQTRLPNGQLLADAAAALSTSTDWLLGLTDRPERPGDLLASAVSMTGAERSAADQQIIDWHREAAGYKIRHVPATLPDMLKTEAMLRWEYDSFLSRTPDQAILATHEVVDWFQADTSDYEIALPIHELNAFAAGAGYYSGLQAAVRVEQLDHLAALCEQMYPRLRLFLFDARQVFSAPLTIFGPRVAVIYVGRFYLSFRESERLRSLTSQFDWLVREAVVDARDLAGHIRSLNVAGA